MEEIASSSADLWGDEQAARYRSKIYKALERIERHPGSGAVFAPLPMLRSVKAGEHRVYYPERADGLLVVRILHARLDATRHLP